MGKALEVKPSPAWTIWPPLTRAFPALCPPLSRFLPRARETSIASGPDNLDAASAW